MKNRVNGFLKKMFRLQETNLGTTKFDHVEPKEKFFDCAFLSLLLLIEVFLWEVITLNFPTTSLKEFPQSTLSREDTRTLKEQQE